MFSLRAPQEDDAESVLAVLEARDLRDFGVADFTRPVLLDQWRVDGFSPAADSLIAEDQGAVVGYAALFGPGALAFVDPAHEGGGVGTGLLAWLEARASFLRRDCNRQRIAGSNSSGEALLTRAGYVHVRSVWQMVSALDGAATVPDPPHGISIRALDPQADARSLHEADTVAFAGNADYVAESYESFHAEHIDAPDLDPASSRVAHRGGSIVGFALCRRQPASTGYVDLLAVIDGERRRGLGGMLLRSALSAFAAAGLKRAVLDVASDNPRALALYERAGMTACNRVDVYEKPVVAVP